MEGRLIVGFAVQREGQRVDSDRHAMLTSDKHVGYQGRALGLCVFNTRHFMLECFLPPYFLPNFEKTL